MSAAPRPVVLVFVGHYFPGFKAGGILRSVENMVNHLHADFAFAIVTRDRDLGDAAPYAGVRSGEWQTVGHARVRYLAPEEQSVGGLRALVAGTPHDLIYLNSFFEPFTVKLLWSRKLGRMGRAPVVLAPRGEFAWASLKLKYPKKLVFMWLARAIDLYHKVTWHASSAFEADDIVRVMGVNRRSIRIALDLPTVAAEKPDEDHDRVASPAGSLRVVFLSRISPEKNLDFALGVLAKVRARVSFDIIGPRENEAYCQECEKQIPLLPPQVTVRWLGSIPPAEVLDTLGSYDLLFLPSGGENYGHVIAEALTTGTPALISTLTPWRELEAAGLGWDLPLDNPGAFARVIDDLAGASDKDRLERRRMVRKNMQRRLADPAALEGNRELIRAALAGTEGPK